MPVSPARAAAFDILLRVERDKSYASELLHSTTHDRLSTPDHALTTELVMGVLRWRSSLDAEIAASSSQSLSKLDIEVLLALRLALYQLRYLDRVPARAALNESVELVKRARKRSAAPFVNAVLRKLAAAPNPSRIPSEAHSSESIATAFAHPLWLVERWSKAYGLGIAQQICKHNQSSPTTTVRLRSPNAESTLVAEGITLEPGSLLSSSRRILAGDVTKAKAFHNYEVTIHDEGSQLVAALVGSTKEETRILDCCAAPGGKTIAISDNNPASTITALELHPHRARLLQKLLPPNVASRIHVIAADAKRVPLSLCYDRILTDVPCSGTGTLARNPEIKWHLTADDLANLHLRQVAILRSALEQLAPGGRLIYSTCSLEKEENEDVVEEVLGEEKTLRLRDCRKELEELKATGELVWPHADKLTSGPYLRTIPGIQDCDGFFAAILERG